MSDGRTGFTHESSRNRSTEWYTPRYIFDALGLEFDLDPCSPGRDIVPWIPVRRHLTWKENGFRRRWDGNVWMNPPYGTDTPRWMGRLARHGCGIVLVFARVGTEWFQSYAPCADAICFIKSRIQFVPAKHAQRYASGELSRKGKYIFPAREKRGGSGAGSALLAYGEANVKAVLDCGLGWVIDNRVKKKRSQGNLFEVQ